MARSTRSTGQRPVSLFLTTLEDRTTPTTGLIPGPTDNFVSSVTLTSTAKVEAPNGGPIAVSSDGLERIALGSLPGGAPTLRVFDSGGSVIFQTNAYFPGFTGGVRVAFGDMNGDGVDDIATSAGNGGGPHVRVFDGKTFNEIASLFGIDDPNFRGGSYVALGKWGGVPIIITVAGEGGGPRMTIKTLTGQVLDNRFVYLPALRDGGTAATVDVNRDGYDEIITAPGQGGGPHIRVIDGKILATTGQVQSVDWFADDPSLRVGVNVTAGKLGSPCGAALIATTARPGNPDPSWIKLWDPSTGRQMLTAQIPGPLPKMGAFAAFAPSKGASDHPDLLVSAWQEGGDKVFGYDIGGYDYDRWDCAPIVVDPPVSPPPPPPAPLSDLHLVKIADRTTAQTGDTVTFTLTVRNDGPNSATSVLVNDPLTAGFVYLGSSASVGAYNASTGRWTLGDLANGATGALTITARVTSVGSLTNTATASSSVGDPDPADNTSFVVITGTSPPPPPPAPSANLRIQKQASDTTVSIGETETYTVTVTNTGPDTATSVLVNDQLPSGFSFVGSSASVGAYNATTGTWTVGSLANGASATLTITGTIASTGNITNTASVASAIGDPDTADNTAGATVTSYALTQLSANGLFYLVDTQGSGVPIADISVGIGPVTLSRMTITLGTGLWTNVTNLALKVQGALPSDPRLGNSYVIDPTGTILTVDVINYSLTTASEIFRLTADVGAGAVPLQVTSVRAYGHA